MEHSEPVLHVDIVGKKPTGGLTKDTVDVGPMVIGVIGIPLIYPLSYRAHFPTMELLIGTIINLKNTIISAPEYYKFNNWQTLEYVPLNYYESNTIRISSHEVLGLEPSTSLYTVVPTQIGSFI